MSTQQEAEAALFRPALTNQFFDIVQGPAQTADERSQLPALHVAILRRHVLPVNIETRAGRIFHFPAAGRLHVVAWIHGIAPIGTRPTLFPGVLPVP